MIKAVIFDVDGVLLDSFEANLIFFQSLLKKAGYPTPTREEFPKFFHLSMKDAIKAMTRIDSEEEIERIWNMGKRRDVEYPLKLLKLPQGAEDVLVNLSKDYRLAIVTSRIRESIFEAPRLAKLKSLFEVVVSYEDSVNHKPHPEPILLACSKLEINTSDAVYIGDAATDLLAGLSAGVRVIMYSSENHGGAYRQTTDFRKIPEFVEQLSSS